MADRTNGLNNIDIGSGRRGFRNRNLGLGQAGTVVDAEWANGVQEEIIRSIELLGLTPAAGNREQLIQAIRRLAGGNVRTISAGGVTLTADDAGLVLVNATSGSFAVTLPAANAAAGVPLRLTIIRTDAVAGNTLTLNRAGSDTVNGLTSGITLPVGAAVTLVSDGGSAWRLAAAAGLSQQVSLTSAGTTGQTVPWWAARLRARAIGGGGGSGGINGGAASGGGAPGVYGEGDYAVSPGASLSCTVGAGGANGIGGGGTTAGGAGGTTSVGSLLSCPGGGGSPGAPSGNSAGGAPGAAATGASLSIANRGNGGGTVIGGGGGFFAGLGGGSPFGPGGDTNQNPLVPGSGAGGVSGAVDTNGRTGAPGAIILEFRP